ncbi:unnamed protein product [Rhizoctonia solani]|uniref:Uncharacterized protein n=1 Tax=Rhizoctonia solani TaxID=456999 RepID=A0A8H3GP58_9AGAM|nr:unnamed protein product [Rhizoctonia solani]
MRTTPTHFMSYLFQSFVPGRNPNFFSYSKALAVAGWFGLRIALSGLCYLEYRWDMARARIAFEAEEKKEATCQLPAVSSELPAPRPTPNVEPSTPSMDSESMVHDEKAPNESDRVEFPRMDPDSTENDLENRARVVRTVSMSSVDSDDTVWSECQTPAQTSVELPVELAEEPVEGETPKCQEDGWFGTAQEQVVVKSEPERKNPPLRRKRSKYGACPLVLRKPSASLYVSAVTAKTEAT